jgi:hypothetical protein
VATKLKNLVITKVALVDEGSCSVADIKLYKRKEGGSVMGIDEILKSLTEEQRKVVLDAIEKAKGAICPDCKKPMAECTCKGTLAQNLADATKQKETAEAEVKKLKDAANVGAQTEEEILKNANLDPAVKALLERQIAKSKAAEEEVKKMKEKEETDTLIAKSKELTLIPEAETKVFAVLKSVSKIDGAVDKVMEVLKAANELIAKGSALGDIGSGSGTGASTVAADAAWAAIEKEADALVTKGQQTSRAKAIDFVIKNKPELYNTYVEALRSEN